MQGLSLQLVLLHVVTDENLDLRGHNWVTELFEQIVLWGGGSDGFMPFCKAFSWETDLWITLGDLRV